MLHLKNSVNTHCVHVQVCVHARTRAHTHTQRISILSAKKYYRIHSRQFYYSTRHFNSHYGITQCQMWL